MRDRILLDGGCYKDLIYLDQVKVIRYSVDSNKLVFYIGSVDVDRGLVEYLDRDGWSWELRLTGFNVRRGTNLADLYKLLIEWS